MGLSALIAIAATAYSGYSSKRSRDQAERTADKLDPGKVPPPSKNDPEVEDEKLRQIRQSRQKRGYLSTVVGGKNASGTSLLGS